MSKSGQLGPSPELAIFLMRAPVHTGRRPVISHRRQQPAGASGPVTRLHLTPADVEARSRELEAERLARR